ncbi:MAG: hypothetical protein AMXMBFR8_26880 [Nevskiales bacterium]
MAIDAGRGLRLFLELCDWIAATGGGPADAKSWFLGTSHAWLEGSDARALDKVLGLTRSHRQLYVRHRRDVLLRRAAGQLAPDANPWTQAGLLAAEIELFGRRFWPSWHQGTIDPHASDLRSTLAALFRMGVRLPRTQRKLYRVLTAKQLASSAPARRG